jgi:hypothetical protein
MAKFVIKQIFETPVDATDVTYVAYDRKTGKSLFTRALDKATDFGSRATAEGYLEHTGRDGEIIEVQG